MTMTRAARNAFKRQSDAVYDELRRLIIRTELTPGAPIEEAVLMKRLGVGRTPLREALQRLAQEDLIRNLPRRGYFVTDTSAADLLQVFEVRQSLEKLSARLAAERAGPTHLAEYERMLGEARLGIAQGNEDMVWNLAIDEWFHQLLAGPRATPIWLARSPATTRYRSGPTTCRDCTSPWSARRSRSTRRSAARWPGAMARRRRQLCMSISPSIPWP